MSSKRSYIKYSEETLERALEDIRTGETTINEASKIYSIPRGTLQNKIKHWHMNPVGKPKVFSEDEENKMVDYILLCASWGFPMTKLDVRYLAKSYIDKLGREVTFFNKNLPGPDWMDKFLSRHSNRLTQHLANNIKRNRASVSREMLQAYFDNLQKEIEAIPASNIFNYDETNFQDDPRKKKVLTKRGTKYVDRIMNSTKTAISVMFCGAADGTVLPPYVVYKSEHLWNSWVERGPKGSPLCDGRLCCRKGSRFNRTAHGWFEATTFTDWFQTALMPHLKHLDGPKVVLGDNLSSHFTTDILKLCNDNNIRFICLPPNSMHLCQPLDVAFFAPMKKMWRQVLENYKRSHSKAESMQKGDFPALLKQMIQDLGSRCNDNLKAGFEACGICPFNPKRVLKKVPGEEDTESQDSSVCSEALSESVLAVLQTMRFDKKDKPKVSKKKLKVDAGKSITEICATDSDDEAPRSSKSAKKSRVVQIEEESESEEENAGESKICLVEDVSEIEHEFVAVIYENHWWVGLAEEICPDQSDIKIKFMHPHGPSKAYQWPGKEDMCWVKLENVLCKINVPPIPKSSRAFALDQETSNIVEQLFLEK